MRHSQSESIWTRSNSASWLFRPSSQPVSAVSRRYVSSLMTDDTGGQLVSESGALGVNQCPVNQMILIQMNFSWE